MTRQLLIAIAALAMLGAACEPRPPAEENGSSGLDASFDSETLVVVNDEGNRHRFDVYIAADFDQQRRGLMFVRKLPETSGMLFVYENTGVRSMWMKNTYIPLDILFIRADGSIANIVTNTVPLSLDSVAAIEPLNYALELNAGVTERLGIDTESRVYFPDI